MILRFRYFRWSISERKATTDSVQVGALRLTLAGSAVSWSSGAVAVGYPNGSSVYTSPSDEQVNALIGGASVKWLVFVPTATVYMAPSVVATIDNKMPVNFDGYQMETANDAPGRDPVSWTLHGSNDKVAWHLIGREFVYQVTASRDTYTPVLRLFPPNPRRLAARRVVAGGGGLSIPVAMHNYRRRRTA